jgi:peroxiredoxin
VLNLDDEPAARAFVQAEGATFPILFDEEGAVQRAYSVRGMPTSVLVGGNGQVVVLHIGQLTAEKLDEYLAQLKP